MSEAVRSSNYPGWFIRAAVGASGASELHVGGARRRLKAAAAAAVWQARGMYDGLVEKVRLKYQAQRVKDGVFGAKMDVALVNDGPVTFALDFAVK
jgi:hypothetical protein